MNIKKLDNFLANDLRLSKKQVEIINALNKNDLSAQELCRAAKVPLGRIYSYLNELIRLELVNKTNEVPAKYSVKGMGKGITKFLDSSLNDFFEKKKQLLSLIEAPEQETIFIDNKVVFTNELIKMWYEAGSLNALYNQLSAPLFVYPHNKNAFLEDRKLVWKARETITEDNQEINSLFFDANFNAYASGKKINYIACKKALDFYFNLIKSHYGREELRQRIEEIRKNFKKFRNVKINVLDESNVLHVYVAPHKAVVTFGSARGGTLAGIVTYDEKMMKFYQKLFDDALARCISFESYLRSLKI